MPAGTPRGAWVMQPRRRSRKRWWVGGWVGGWVEGGIFWLGLSPWEGSFWRFAAAFAAIELSPLQQSSSASWPASPPLPCTLPARLPAARCR